MADMTRNLIVTVGVDDDQLREALARHLLDLAADIVGRSRARAILDASGTRVARLPEEVRHG